jgi:hypothetical protein
VFEPAGRIYEDGHDHDPRRVRRAGVGRARNRCPTGRCGIYRPWCVQYGGNDGDNGTTCAFTSFEQCMMTARGGGGFCVQNPWYLAYGSGQKSPESTGRSNRTKRR